MMAASESAPVTATASEETLLEHPPEYTRRDSTPSTRPAPIEHTCSLVNSNKRPWATLRLASRARASNHVPYFYQGETISGRVNLTLEKEDNIRAVDIELSGWVGSSAIDGYRFISVTKNLWKIPTNDSSEAGPSFIPQGVKLSGEHSWPFSLNLPATITTQSKGETFPTEHMLPPSFHEKGSGAGRVNVQYQLTVHFRRIKFRIDNKLMTVIAYTPLVTPGPPSELRQLAYSMGSPLLGVEADPAGWKSLEPYTVEGTIFKKRFTEVVCTLSLATPLSYTRGTVIPLVLTLASPDAQALGLLAAPSIPDVRLLRHVSHDRAAAAKAKAARLDAAGNCRGVRGGSLPGVDFKVSTKFIESAVFWPSAEGAQDNLEHGRQRLDGEIRLPSDLKPSCAIAQFELWYSVVVYPSETTAFVPNTYDSLRIESVQIATAYAPGPRPRVLSPPGYVTSLRSRPGGLYHTRSAIL